MEDKNELNDILIKNGEKGGNNLKNILLFAAVTLLVFFIGVLAFKMLSQEEAKERAQAVLPEAPTSAVEQTFEKEPLSATPADEGLSAYKEILEKNRRKNAEAEAPAEAPAGEENVVADTALPEATPPTPPVPAVEALPEPEAAPEIKTEPKPSVLDESKKDKPAPKPQAKKEKHYYIQVAALSQFDPNKKFLATITDNKYQYTIVKRTVNGLSYKRVYIGPFASSKEAEAELPKVKEKITPKAFVVKD